MPLRALTKDEERLLTFLVHESKIKVSPDWKQHLLVSPMDDGGMGSLLLFPRGKQEHHRKFGNVVAEYIFKDADGADVIASLNVDQNNELFELDIWKTTFDPLVRIPANIP